MAELNGAAIVSRAQQLKSDAAELCERARCARQAAVEQRKRAGLARARGR